MLIEGATTLPCHTLQLGIHTPLEGGTLLLFSINIARYVLREVVEHL